MGWLSTLLGNNSNDAKEFSQIEAANDVIGGLNFKTALEAHIKWKLRLKGVIDGSGTEVLDPRTVSKDDECVLGKWLYGEGQKKFGTLTVFNELVSSHAEFHKCAGHTLELALEGKTPEAEKELIGGCFARASLTVSRHLMRLWRDVGIDH